MIRHKSILILLIMMACLYDLSGNSDKSNSNQGVPIPDAIQEIMNNPLYQGAIWGLRVVDLDTGELVYDLNPNTLFPHSIGFSGRPMSLRCGGLLKA
jgi:D-alanyl-D-alanine carboxypeptidase